MIINITGAALVILLRGALVVMPECAAGTVLAAAAAAVYQLSKDGQVVGLAVSSEAAE